MESKVSNSGNNNKNPIESAGFVLSNVDLKLLRVFKYVVEFGGFTAASRELNTGLAAISKQVSDLEIRLGMTLCTRGREGFDLTQHGINVYQATLELFTSLSLFRERVHNTRKELLGDITICIVDNTISDPHSPVTNAVQHLHHKAPKVKILLQTASIDNIERGIIEGRLNCGIGPVYEIKDEFDYYPLYTETSKIYCSPSHPVYSESNNGIISDKKLREQKLINHLYIKTQDMRRLVPCQESGIQAVQVESVAILILTGCFIGYLPDHYAAPYVERGQLCELGDESFHTEDIFYLIIKKGRQINPIIRLFMTALGIQETSVA